MHWNITGRRRRLAAATWVLGLAGAVGPLQAFERRAPQAVPGTEPREYRLPELTLSTRSVPLEALRSALPDATAWDVFLERHGTVRVFLDARSGTPANIVGHLALVPGDGRDNRLTWTELSQRLGSRVERADAGTLRAALVAFVREHRETFGIDPAQLGPGRVFEVRPGFWQLSLPQVLEGVPVRDARLLASVQRGNLVLFGTEYWSDVQLDSRPQVTARQALETGFAHAGGRRLADELLGEPRLELLPLATGPTPADDSSVRHGYAHRLVWSFRYRQPDSPAVWEALVDAHSGELVAFSDVNHYIQRPLTGGVYPVTSTGSCLDPRRCGALRNLPMPFADTGTPGVFTTSAGLFSSTLGGIETTLSGRFVDVDDRCGNIAESANVGPLNLGGVNGDHDCEHAGQSQGNTASARTAFYELNKIIELARGFLPTLPFLQGPVDINTNLNQTCNAFWDPAANNLNMFRSGGGCRNSGEIASILDHEWGHGLDDHDAGGALSSTSEGYADIAALYRQGASCVGLGLRSTDDTGCGNAADGSGKNANHAQQGSPHCALDCSGVREADWDRHADHTPDTPQNFVCSRCFDGPGPCGRQVHCASAPISQAAWDLVARDLRAAPFNLDANSALILGNKLFYEGSGNIGVWYECSCTAGTSAGCGAGSGYMNWLAADDDNGSLADGTPHMTALFAAFNRHGIACAQPAPVNDACLLRPGVPSVTLTPGPNRVTLRWNSVRFASEYWVFRSEGSNACGLGKARIARVAGTTFTDTGVANSRPYCYSVMARGANDQCFRNASACTCVTPDAFTFTCTPTTFNLAAGGSQTASCSVSGSGESPHTSAAFSCTGLPPGASCSFSPPGLPLSPDVVYSTQLTLNTGSTTPAGSFAVQAVANYGQLVTRSQPLQVNVTSTAPNFVLTCADTDLVVGPGGTRTTTCTAVSQNGLAATLSLACSSPPADGVSCSVSPATLSLPANGGVTTTLQVQAGVTAGPGVRVVQLSATGGGLTRSVDVSVEVVDPNDP